MKLELESGRIIPDVTEKDIREQVEREEFAILSIDSQTYVQCAEQSKEPYQYVLEYQDGSIDEHFVAIDEPITLERVLSTFVKYLHRDESWRTDFIWEKMSW